MTPERRRLRGVRGATTVERDEALLICAATRELLTELLVRNGVTAADVVSAMFTATADLRSEFPARAARDLGWDDVATLCAVEMPVAGALPRCVRVSLHVELPEERVARHAYLRGAEVLRPDRQTESGDDALRKTPPTPPAPPSTPRPAGPRRISR